MKKKIKFIDLPGYDKYKCNIIAEAFQRSVDKGYDSIEFMKTVMTSKKLEALMKFDDCYEWADGCVLLDKINRLTPLKKGKTIDSYMMWFIGYTYKYWLLTWDITRAEVWEYLPAKKFIDGFGYFHTLDYDAVINTAIKRKTSNS